MRLSSPTPRQAAVELVFVAAFWGFGFVATQWALETWSPLGVLLWRFAGAFLLGEGLYFLFKALKKTSHQPQTKSPPWMLSRGSGWDRDFFLAAPAGLLLGSFLLLQTIGLQFTTASKSGFITTLYVLIVPFLNWMLFRKKHPLFIFGLGGLACVGMWLLMDIQIESMADDINVGDLWTLMSAVLAAGHIIYIGRIVQKVQNPFRLNNFQTLWALLTVSPAVFITSELQHAPLKNESLLGVIILAGACSVIAFFVQVRAQKILSDTTASMLFLLESPYAFLFAYILLGDRFTTGQGLGAALILGAALLTVVLEPSSQTNKTQ
jgi:drug/metabolite transporter (DMT)-like permease